MLGMVLAFTGCSKSEMNEAQILQQETKITELNTKIAELEKQKTELDAVVIDEKIEKGVARYIVTLHIKQSHVTLSLKTYAKDKLNAIDVEVPVDKEFYDSVEIDTVIDDSFRTGSMILNGSFGSWDITVAKKEIR